MVFEQIYEWIRSIAVCLVVMTAVLHAVPGKDYVKYIRFFTGLVLIILMFTPLLKLSGMEQRFRTIWADEEYRMNRKEIEDAAGRYEKLESEILFPEEVVGGENGSGDAPASGDESEAQEGKIEVEEIVIGE